MKGYRTLLLALVTATIGIVEVYDFARIIPERHQGWALLVFAILIAWLRILTTTPVFESPEQGSGEAGP